MTQQSSTVLTKKSQKSVSMLTKLKGSRKQLVEERTNEDMEESSNLEMMNSDESVSIETEISVAETSIKDLRIG